MLPSHLAMSAIASVLLSVTGWQALIPLAQPIEQEAVGSPVYPKGLEWQDLLNRDPELYELASCESQLNPKAINHGDALITGHPSYGLLQFQPNTFLTGVKAYNALPGASDKEILAAIYDPYVQIYVARHMINDKQGPQWTCYNLKQLAKKYPWKTSTQLEGVSKK